MFAVIVIVAVALTSIVNGQRSPYAGSRPASGYKDRFQPAQAGANDIGNRLGEATTERLPYDAYGDAFIVQHSNSLPIDNRPFWILNQAHIEAQRGTPTNAASGSLAPQPALTAANATAQANNTNANRNNNNNIADRFAVNNNLNTNLQDNTNYDPNVITQPQIVYPENITPDQRQQMQAFYEQQRLQAIAQRQQQQQQQQQPQQQQQQPQPQQQQQQQQQLQLQQQQQQSLGQNQQNPSQNINQNQQQISQPAQSSNQQQNSQQPNAQPQLMQISNEQLTPSARPNLQLQPVQSSNFVAPNFEQRFPQVPHYPQQNQFPHPVFPGPQHFPQGSFHHRHQRFLPDSRIVAPYFVDFDS